MSRRSIFVFTILVTLVLSDGFSDEKSQCRADSCDGNAEAKLSQEPVEERDSGVHLAYNCDEPHFVPEEDYPVILLHGSTDVRSTWDGIYQNIPILTHRKACVYDARNHGDSGWGKTLDVDVLAEDVGHLMDKLKIEKAVLVGHSLGGLTALKFALDNPNRVDKIFVEDISPVSIPQEAMIFVETWFQLLRKGISFIPAGADEKTAKKTVVDFLQEAMRGAVPPHFVKDIPIIQRNGLWQWKVNLDLLYDIVKKPDTFFAKYEGIYEGKVFFIYGGSSPFGVGNQKDEILKIFPNSEFHRVEGAGHLVHSGHPEFVTQLIKFLE